MSIPSPILIIGGGTMGSAMAKRWRSAHPNAALHVVDRGMHRRAQLADLGCHTYASLDDVKLSPKIIVVSVKPQQFADIAEQVKKLALNGALLISVMAGVPLSRLHAITHHCARVMPNTPTTIGEGISAIAADGLDEKSLEQVKHLFGALGSVVIIDERDMHAVAATSGSGPAYVFAFMEAMIDAAVKQGLSEQLARTLVVQTVRGAALLADQSAQDISELREAVTSKGGMTAEALRVFSESQLNSIVADGMEAAIQRSKELK